MSNSLTVLIPHNLGKEEALRRLQSGLSRIDEHFSAAFVVQEQIWPNNTLQFQIRALAQTVRGTIEAQDTQVKLDLVLPWLLAWLASNIRQVVQMQAAASNKDHDNFCFTGTAAYLRGRDAHRLNRSRDAARESECEALAAGQAQNNRNNARRRA
jgi:Putative polyhydroxyalkanoic acid system protein (PHA_gran_rgn)